MFGTSINFSCNFHVIIGTLIRKHILTIQFHYYIFHIFIYFHISLTLLPYLFERCFALPLRTSTVFGTSFGWGGIV